MTIRYKSETFDLTTTNVTTILTCPSDATIIVKALQTSHQAASNVDVDVFLQKSGGSDVEISHAQLNKSFINMVSSSLNLEASDVLKVQADTANQITGAVSYALIDRSQENG
jgi:Neuraminidase (sialidase)